VIVDSASEVAVKKCNLKDHKSDDDKKIKDYKKRESHQINKPTPR
jgi:hypothetical protein